MAYITADDLIARYGIEELLDVADRDGDGTADPAVLDAAIGDAQRDIDAQIGGRHAVPLLTVPELVVRICCQLTRYYLHRVQPPEWVRNGYRDALAALADIRDGRVTIDAPSASTPAPASGRVLGVSAPPVFAGGRLTGF